MVAYANPFYYGARGGADPAALGASIGQSLGTALFGDPEKAAKLQQVRQQMALQAAQQQEAEANAGRTAAQTEGIQTQNTAAKGIPDVVSRMFLHQNVLNPTPISVPDVGSFNAANLPAGPVAAQPVVAPDTSNAPAQAADLANAPQTAETVYDPQTFRNGLPALVATLGQAQGDKVDPNAIAGLLSAFSGSDELARAGLVGQGKTPGAEFALTPERADDIRQQGYGAELNKATTVANIDAAPRYQENQLTHTDRVREQDLTHSDRIRGQDIESSDRRYSYNLKPGADLENNAGANVIARALGPSVVITSNARTPQEQRNVYATQHPGKAPIMDSAHLDAADGYPAFDIRPMPGKTFEQAREAVAQQAAAQGGYLRFAQDEGTHWHFDVRGAKTNAVSTALTKPAVKAVNSATSTMLFGKDGASGALATALSARGINPPGFSGKGVSVDQGTMQNIKDAVVATYQKTGNPEAAVNQTLDALQQRWNAKRGAPSSSSGGGNVAAVKQAALAAIGKGANPNAVRARFKQMTGQDLGA